MTKILPPDPSKSHLLTHLGPRRDGQTASPKDTSNQAPANPPGGDKAEISTRAQEFLDLRAAVDAGRATLEELEAVEAVEARTEKMASVRERLASGFYQSAEVRDQVAGRLSSLFIDHPLF